VTDDLDVTPCAWCKHPAYAHQLTDDGSCGVFAVWTQCTCIQMTRPRETR